MSTSTLMSIGTRAMNAAYAQLMTASNNIANANTPGYSRQSVLLAPTEGQYTGSGYFGRGVTVQSVTRASNAFLTQQAQVTGSAAAGDSARSSLLQQLEKVFGTDSAGLGAAANGVINAWSDLASTPGDLSARQAVIGALNSFAALASSQSSSLAQMQSGVVQDVGNTVTAVNAQLAQLAQLNQSIVQASGNGQAPNDLLDQRDALIAKIGQSLQVSTVAAPDGSTSVFTLSGQSLVLGAQANQLVAQADACDPQRVAVAVKVGSQTTPFDATALGGGSIAGQLAFQNNDLVDARNRLGQLVAGFAGALNRQQSLGLDLSGQPGAALLQLSPPQALPAATNATVGGSFSAAVNLTITDPTALQASEYVFAVDPAHAGHYTVTRLSDGRVTSNVADGDTVDGFAIHVASPLAAGDRFLLQPVSTAADSVQVAASDPRALAAASPLTVSAPAANTGTAGITRFAVTNAPTQPYQALTLKFTSAAGDWQLCDAGGTVQASGTLVAGQPIVYNGFALSLSGAPAAGDQFNLAPTPYPAADNGNALAIDAMAQSPVVGGATVTDAYAQLLADVGSRSAGAQSASQISTQAAAAASSALSSEVGVNLDEEAARLMQYQQSYQAAAKILQTAQSVLDTLTQLGN